jgi:hypothetical protein
MLKLVLRRVQGNNGNDTTLASVRAGRNKHFKKLLLIYLIVEMVFFSRYLFEVWVNFSKTEIFGFWVPATL